MKEEKLQDTIRYFIKSEDELRTGVNTQLEDYGFNVEKGSIVNLFSNIILNVVSKCYDNLRKMHLNCFVSTAEGVHLDEIASTKALTRLKDESDIDLRYRITQADKFNAACNLTAIKQEIMNYNPEVYDVKILNYTQGAGSCSVYVYSNIEDKDKLNSIKEKIAYKLPCGVGVSIEYPVPSLIAFKIKINAMVYSDTEKIDIRKNILKQLETALINVKPNESISYYDIVNLINNCDTHIVSCSVIGCTIDNTNVRLSQLYCQPSKKLVLSKNTELIF